MQFSLVQSHSTLGDGDLHTPVAVYLKLRDIFPGALLLESTDFQVATHCRTFICVDPIGEFSASREGYVKRRLDLRMEERKEAERVEILQAFQKFYSSHSSSLESDKRATVGASLYGFSSFDAVQIFDTVKFTTEVTPETDVPALFYQCFRFVLVFDRKRNTVSLVEHRYVDGSQEVHQRQKALLLKSIQAATPAAFPFAVDGEDESAFTDEAHEEMILQTRQHTFRGDVFQIVPSRRFSRKYTGDDFAVYRALREVNPSPYLFYFDYGDFRVFGSSPETHVATDKGIATIHPIAGSAPRGADETEDEQLRQELLIDQKENAEHVMLVDLARNDLSRCCSKVSVVKSKEIHVYSHVQHMVSEVQGVMDDSEDCIGLLAATFPNGTVSGAPKYRALELLDQYEPHRRGFYSGVIGCLGFDGSSLHAITIRTFWSHRGVLYRQAGGGVVAGSVAAKEVQEVKNKLGALCAALELAATRAAGFEKEAV